MSDVPDTARIIAQAEEAAGISDPEPHLRRNLEALIAAFAEGPALGAAGAASAQRALVSRTVDRLTGLKWLRDHPEIGDERIEAPIFLTGLPRSGTTYFQYLFDRDRRFRQIRTWESSGPNPPPGAAPETIPARRAAWAEMRGKWRPREVENFDALHLIDDDGPDECHAFMEQAWAAAGYLNLYDVPAYFDFLMDEIDMAAAYRVHRRQLQLLQWRTPQPRWSLKYPNHLIAMDAILEVYPDARFVMTHRDPVQTLASIANMTLALRTALYEDAPDPHRIGRQMLHFVRRHIDRIMAFCTGPHAERVTHVDYYRVASNPAAILGEIHRGIGIDTPPAVLDEIAGWRQANPKNKRGANPYSVEQFGLNGDEAAELFSDYMAHFAIPREAVGLARSTAAA